MYQQFSISVGLVGNSCILEEEFGPFCQPFCQPYMVCPDKVHRKMGRELVEVKGENGMKDSFHAKSCARGFVQKLQVVKDHNDQRQQLEILQIYDHEEHITEEENAGRPSSRHNSQSSHCVIHSPSP